jgi:hypothetical protein
MQYLFWPVVLPLLTLVFLGLFGKPSPLLLTGSGAAAILFAAVAAYFWVQVAGMPKLAEVRFYTLEVESPGTHVLKIAPIPGVPGVNVRPVPKGLRRKYQSFAEQALPVSLADIRSCGWKLRPPARPVHFHDEDCQCSPKDYLFESGFDDRVQSGSIPDLELEYVVDDRTRPTLAAIDLQVGYPFSFGNNLAMGEAFGSLFAWGFAGCAALGGLGVVSQVVRLRNRGRGDDRGTLHSPLPR